MDVNAAYRHCWQLTRQRARNFAYGIRLLPPPRRAALAAVYAFARRIDDIGDGDLPTQTKLEALERARADLAALLSGGIPQDPVVVALADAARRFPIPLEAFAELVEGVEWDVRGVRYPDFSALHAYCRRVAGSIGRLSLGTFECRDRARGEQLADDLGVALQLTNILRDVVEDHRAGRVYLPADTLGRFGVGADLDGPTEGLLAAIAAEAERAERWFARGWELLDLLDRRSAACVATMAGIYHRLLRRIRRDPASVLRGRVSLPAWQKGAVAARSLVGVAR